MGEGMKKDLNSQIPAGSDLELWTRFTQTNDPALFDEVVRNYETMVKRICYRILGNWPDAEDAAQAAFITLLKKGIL
jgi:DNA-directed RNA polymerase specialized sigma subunit